ncbi:hypothetical protein P8452_77373 [Trifolium repens]|nr:hypothetical protein P8452_77373 [Trifolium repens]
MTSDRCCTIPQERDFLVPSLEDAGYLSFYSLVHDEMNRQVRDAILAMPRDAGQHYWMKVLRCGRRCGF